MDATPRLPTLYIPHGGGPCFFIDPPASDPRQWDGLAAYLRGIDASLGARPKAVLVISGHWEMQQPTITVAQRHKLLFDYYGFPEHTYRMKYPAPGAPELESRIRELLAAAGFELGVDGKRGLDHGVFVPFMLIYPNADVPIVQLSLQQSLDPATHLALGERSRRCAIARRTHRRQRDELSQPGGDVLWRRKRRRPPRSMRGSARPCAMRARAGRSSLHGRARPAVANRIPRAEHLLPLMVVAGAADGDAGMRKFGESIAGKAISGFQFG